MTIETIFPEKVTCSDEAHDCLFTSLRNDGELNLPFLDIENRIRNVTLREHNLILVTFQYCFSPAHLGEEALRVKRDTGALSRNGFAFVTHWRSREQI